MRSQQKAKEGRPIHYHICKICRVSIIETGERQLEHLENKHPERFQDRRSNEPYAAPHYWFTSLVND